MKSGELTLGIDLGTSAVKAVACRGRETVATATVPLTTDSPHPGWSEQPPERWLQAAYAAVGQLLAQPAVSQCGIAGIGLSGQMHGAVLLDGSLNALRACILWNDSRSHAECHELLRRKPDIGMRAGVLPLPGFTAPKIMWVKRHEPETYARIAHLLLPKDWLGFRLHGKLATDTSDAAGTLLLDQRRRSWSAGLGEAASTRAGWLPEIHDGHQIAGHLLPGPAEILGLQAGIPIVAGAGDAAAGAVAVGATMAGNGFISLGTSGQLFLATDRYAPNPERYVHAFSHTLPDRWYQMAAMLNGARPLSWLAGILGCEVADVVKSAAEAAPDRVPLFLPYLTGERSPHGDPHIRSAFYGLEDRTDTQAICRSVIESIAFSFADAADSFAGQLDGVPRLLAIGGGTGSSSLLQMIADATGKTILKAAAGSGGPAFGAAQLAAVGIGRAALSDLSQPQEFAGEFTPRDNPLLRERLEKYRALYRALKNVFQ
ncbi:MAG: xylulokinase [Rhodobacteraceae bacterium]|nr:xylulokinase [Paracoccaceae bacterium]